MVSEDKLLISPATAADLPEVRKLFLAYRETTDAELCFQAFERELAELPGSYAPPAGAILLAKPARETVGCVAMRPLGKGECELKRLYVIPQGWGKGAGSVLVAAVVDCARQSGYRCMSLETLPFMFAAGAIYRRQGFEPDDHFTHNSGSGIERYVLRLEEKQ